MLQSKFPVGIAIALFSSFVFTSCTKENPVIERDASNEIQASGISQKKISKGVEFYALTSSNVLVKYSSGNPLTELGSAPITGLQSMERILAIDFRPSTGQLYGLSDQSRLYVIDKNTGVAAAVSPMPFTPAISGTEVGFDFNPTVDRIRLVTNLDQNLRLNPVTGAVAAVDGMITPSSASVSAVAYTNSFSGATTTILYDIDVATDKLYKQIPPNNGTLVEVGPLGIQALGEAGFDIAPDNSVAITAFYGRGFEDGQQDISNGNKYRFYYIDLATGAATNAGKTDREIIGVAIPGIGR